MRTCNQNGCTKRTHRDTYMCKQHLKEYRAAYYLRTKDKAATNYNNPCSPGVIRKELEGKNPIQGGLYQDCTFEQIQALQNGDVEQLRKMKTTDIEQAKKLKLMNEKRLRKMKIKRKK